MKKIITIIVEGSLLFLNSFTVFSFSQKINFSTDNFDEIVYYILNGQCRTSFFLVLYQKFHFITFILMKDDLQFISSNILNPFFLQNFIAFEFSFETSRDILLQFFSFAILSFLLILSGFLGGFAIRFPLGIGVMLYGIGYFLVHDTFFHRRIKIKYRPKSNYVKRILNAHTVHHQKSNPHKGVCFGFLYASKKYEVTE